METSVIPLIILGAISVVSHGAGVLPDSLTAAVGGTVMFTTTVTPPESPFLVVTWGFSDIHGGSSSIITSSNVNITGPAYTDRVTLFRSTGSLELSNLTISDIGEYTVTLIHTAGGHQRGICRLVLHTPVSNVTVTANTTDLVESSRSLSLSCSSSGSSLSFLWLNISSEVTASDRVQLTDGNSTLTIVNVTRYDQGPFRCHVFNPVSNGISDPVNLFIIFGPENIDLTLSPSQEYYDEGSDISLMCSAVSSPAALFQWFLNGDLLSDTGPELRLINLQMSQSGNYSCQAFNKITMKTQTSQPAVLTVLKSHISNVVISANTTDLVEFSSSVRLSCSSSGSSLSFLWLNISSEVTASDRVQLTDGNSTLTIVNVTRYDQGPFRCNVSNGVSNGISQSVNLVIQYGPDNVTVVGPKSVHVGDLTMLYCSTMSVPSSKFTWLFKGKATNGHEAVYVIQSSRHSEGGTYTCTAENTVTGQSQTAHHVLTVIDFSNCDCLAATGRTTIITAGCCLIIVAVIGIIVYCLVKRKRVNSTYPLHHKEKLRSKEKNSDVYNKITGTIENNFYSPPLRQK
ncbi:carcinoembryonic antigen-related cell adhesion molecule 5-like [Xiphias gladius]|uniref:carcinoembryonic antigen-related cell adhesion molecule 5-like n=1 Tax=Xiphias gladius TaxID=8245 RepID=UPI001A97F362|nr:carcinoembryonic antigen-related cell adhesion molecule 5-like [Xiphias gladius]